MKLTLISIGTGRRQHLARFAYLPGDGRTITWTQLAHVFPEIDTLPRYHSVSLG